MTLIDRASAPLLARALFESGDPGPIVASLAHVPELLGPTLPFLGAVLGPSWIALRDKEIVILRTSAVMGCRYCTEAHTVVALDSGLSRDEVRGLRGELALVDAFPDIADRALSPGATLSPTASTATSTPRGRRWSPTTPESSS